MSNYNTEERKLTPKQERYVQGVVAGLSQRKAYRKAYSSSNTWKDETVDSKASALLSVAHIRKRFDELMEDLNRERTDSFNSKRVSLDEDVYELAIEYSKDHESLKDFVQESIVKNLPDSYKDFDEWLKRNRRQNIGQENRYEVLNKAGFRCQACGNSPEKDKDCTLEVDHIKPFSLGGIDHISNYQCLCRLCNISKGNRYSIDHR